MSTSNAVDDAIYALFKAYDIDESGELSRTEFLGIEMRLNFEEGNEFRAVAGAAKLTLADANSSGTLDFEEFRTRTLSGFQELNLSSEDIIRRLHEHTKRALMERARMGPRSHPGIRQNLRQLFTLFDVSGDGVLSPEEWIAAQKSVALEVTDDFDEGWIDEAAFGVADANGDGVLDMNEFLEASFSMFEGVKKRSDAIHAILENLVQAVEQERLAGRKETQPVEVLVQAAARPAFQPPQAAWRDEPTVESDDPELGSEWWQTCGELALPLTLSTAEDVAALLRLFLKKPPDTWLSVFFLGAPREGGTRPATLLRGERPGEGNVQAMLQYLSKANADLRLFVKNVRKRPSKLTRQPRAFLEERDSLLARRSGQRWCLDWETQLVGEGQGLPPRPLGLHVGDALVVEVPVECGAPLDRYACSIFMDRTDVLSKPVDESIVPKAKKKPKKKPAAAAPAGDALTQLTFVGLQEGTCVLFVDVSWEDQEEKLSLEHNLVRPVRENSVARIGPLEVLVQGKEEAHPDAAGSVVWWNGEKWSSKKGPAKKKGKKR